MCRSATSSEGGTQYLTHETGLSSAFEQSGEDVHHGVHDRPGEVAAEDADEQRMVVGFLSSKADRAGEAERHDQAEQDLAEPACGIEVAFDEGPHSCAPYSKIEVHPHSENQCRIRAGNCGIDQLSVESDVETGRHRDVVEGFAARLVAEVEGLEQVLVAEPEMEDAETSRVLRASW